MPQVLRKIFEMGAGPRIIERNRYWLTAGIRCEILPFMMPFFSGRLNPPGGSLDQVRRAYGEKGGALQAV